MHLCADRWTLEPLGHDIVAFRGALLCAEHALLHRAPAVAEAVVLAWFEQVYRVGRLPQELDAVLRASGEASSLADRLLHLAPQATVQDVAWGAASLPSVWGAELRAATLNPTFSGSACVGGADADWITNTTLWEAKTNAGHRPFGRAHLLQAFGYALLDGDDAFSLAHVGWYYARHQWQQSFALNAPAQRLARYCNVASLRVAFWQNAVEKEHV